MGDESKSHHDKTVETVRAYAQIGAALVAIATAFGSVKAWGDDSSKWLFGAFLIATAIGVTVACFLRAGPRAAKPKPEALDVDAILSQTFPIPAEPRPIANATEAVLKPSFHAFTFDDIDSLHWEWKWKPEATEPDPDSIESLACFCPKCKLRIDPKEESRGRREKHGSPKPWDTVGATQMWITIYDYFTRFACEGGCFATITRNVNLKAELSRIRRMIEQRAKRLLKENLP
jgi:hypothetical protein